MRTYTESSMGSMSYIITYRLFGAKSLFELILTYC